MRISVIRLVSTAVVLSVVLLLGSAAIQGQVPAVDSPSRLDVAFTYNPMLANVTTGKQFWMQGGSAQIHAALWHRVGIVGNVIGLHTGDMNNSGVGLDLIAYTAGLRYTTASGKGRLIYFGEALGGAVHGANSIFPAANKFNTTGNSLAIQVGGGISRPISYRLAIRIIEADWLRTELPNATTGIQNNFRLGAGIQYRFR